MQTEISEEKRKRFVDDETERETINDQFDIFELTSRVHSTSPILNRDFTLAWTTQSLETWAEKQMLLANNIYEILEPVHAKTAKQIKEFMLDSVKARILFTRSREGRVLKSGLSYNKDEKFEKELEEKKQRNFLGKLFSKPEKSEEVSQ